MWRIPAQTKSDILFFLNRAIKKAIKLKSSTAGHQTWNIIIPPVLNAHFEVLVWNWCRSSRYMKLHSNVVLLSQIIYLSVLPIWRPQQPHGALSPWLFQDSFTQTTGFDSELNFISFFSILTCSRLCKDMLVWKEVSQIYNKPEENEKEALKYSYILVAPRWKMSPDSFHQPFWRLFSGVGQQHTWRPVGRRISERRDQTVSWWASAFWERRHVYDLSETNTRWTALLAAWSLFG